MSDSRVKIGITQGDTNGVGWEVILKIFADNRMCELCTPVLYGSKRVAEHYRRLLEQDGGDKLSFNLVEGAEGARRGRVNLVECGVVKDDITPGKATKEGGEAAIEALVRATEELKSGALDAIVTSPFNKEMVQSDSFSFTGHTEYIASHFEGENMMMMCSETLKVGLVTKHIAVNRISESISKELIVKSLRALRKSLIEDFSVVNPRLAVLALNPHSGDGGLLGREEIEIIKPAIEQSYSEGVLAFGPFSADGFFASEGYRGYDAVLAIYHDQGLIPFKTLYPEGVNFTAGLTAVRTSPDHGVAYDIAGKGVANPDSMRNAIYMAVDIVRSRETHRISTLNPLQKAEEHTERPNRSRERREPRGRSENSKTE